MDWVALAAVVGAFGSTAVRTRQEEWKLAVHAISRADLEIGMAQGARDAGRPTRIDDMDVWGRLEDDPRPAESATRKALADAIAAELGHRSEPVEAPDRDQASESGAAAPGP